MRMLWQPDPGTGVWQPDPGTGRGWWLPDQLAAGDVIEFGADDHTGPVRWYGIMDSYEVDTWATVPGPHPHPAAAHDDAQRLLALERFFPALESEPPRAAKPCVQTHRVVGGDVIGAGSRGSGSSVGFGGRVWVGARLAPGGLVGAEQPVECGGVGGPCLGEYVAGDLSCCVAKCEGDDDDVVEWADHGQELWDQVDG